MKEASQAQPQLQAIAAWQKEKRRKKRDFALFGARQRLRALDPRKLLKKLDQNLH